MKIDREEVWKDIKGYEGFYQVSNDGRIKSVTRIVNYKDGRKYIYNEQLMVFTINYHRGKYYQIGLSKNGKTRMHRVNVIVGNHFVPNPNNLSQLNHKDENKLNNADWNLEWCDNIYNNNYGSKPAQQSKINRVRVALINIHTNEVKHYNSIKEVVDDNKDINPIIRDNLRKGTVYKDKYKLVYPIDLCKRKT